MGSLQRIKDYSGTWAVKGLLWILVASFALWGIGDMVSNYTRMRPIAKVGGTGISQEEFHAELQKALHNLRLSTKTPMTGEEIRKAGIPKMIIDGLLNQSAVREDIHRLKLVIPDDVVRRKIQSDPMFHNEKGQYDARALVAILQQNHMSEAQFVNRIRDRLLQEQLMSSLASGANLPKKYKVNLYQSIEQKRTFSVVSIPTDKMPEPPLPTDQELKGFYDENQAKFTRPEVRSISVLELDINHLKEGLSLPEEKVKEEFETRKAELSTAEKRDVEEIVFPDEISAKLALDELNQSSKAQSSKAKGKKKKSKKADDTSSSTNEIALTVGKKYNGTYRNYGFVAQSELQDGFAQEAFDAGLETWLMAQHSALGQRVYRVKGKSPAKEASFSEAKTQIVNELKTQQINDTISELRTKVEDALAGGGNYEEIAKTHHLKFYTFDSISSDGKSLDGKVSVPDALRPLIMEPAFTTAEKADSQVIEGNNGSFVVVRVHSIKPTFVPKFDEIKSEVKKAWSEKKRLTAALELADSIAKEVNSSAELAKVTKSKKLSVKVMEPVSFSSITKDKGTFKDFAPNFLNRIFTLKEGQTASAPVLGNTGAMMVMVQSIKPVDIKASPEGFKQFSDNLTRMAQRDVMELYTSYLKETLGVTINQAIFDAIVGSL